MDIAIVLAAGEGTRMKTSKSKVLHTVLAKPILSYVLDNVKKANFSKSIIIAGENEEILRENYQSDDIVFRRQPIGEGHPYGTGYAVMQGLDLVEDNESVLILAGDVPSVRPETLAGMLEYHRDEGYTATVLTAELEDPTDYGRMIKDDDGLLLKIVEERDASDEIKRIKEINSGIFIINGKALKDGLSNIDTDNDQGEYYITDIFSVLAETGEKIGTYLIDDSSEILGINSKVELAEVENNMRKRVNRAHMANGVIIENPDTVFISPDIEIGEDTRIEQNVRIVGDTKIGRDCIIGQGSVIRDCELGDRVKIRSSEIEESFVGDDCTLGPFAHLRPESNLVEDVHLGNFVEVKAAKMDKGSKAAHLTYIGDADIGERVNISCGVIFANYDGKNKFRSKVGNDAFIGSNSNIVAPRNIGNRGYIAAGSTITEDVPSEALAIERTEQKNLENWVVERFGKKEEK